MKTQVTYIAESDAEEKHLAAIWNSQLPDGFTVVLEKESENQEGRTAFTRERVNKIIITLDTDVTSVLIS